MLNSFKVPHFEPIEVKRQALQLPEEYSQLHEIASFSRYSVSSYFHKHC